MKKKQVVARKIPLLNLMRILQNLYGAGANYVDIIAVQNLGNNVDEVFVAVNDEYMAYMEYGDDDEEFDREDEIVDFLENENDKKIKNTPIVEENPLTDGNINNIIDGSC